MDVSKQEIIGKFGLGFLILFVIVINVVSWTIYLLYRAECFSNPQNQELVEDELYPEGDRLRGFAS